MSKNQTTNDDNQRPHKGKNDKRRGPMKGAPSRSSADSKGHRKDDSDGAEKNTTKKQQNSI